MMDFFFITLFFGFLVVFAFMLKLCGESILNISLINITFISLIVFSYIGIFPLYFHLDSYRYSTGVTEKKVILQVFMYSSSSIFLFLFSIIFSRQVAGFKPFLHDRKCFYYINKKQCFYLVLGFILCLLALFHYLSRVESIALFEAISNNAMAAKVARSNMTNAFQGKRHWYNLFIENVAMFVSYSFYAAWLLRKRLTFFILFLIGFLYLTFTSMMTTEKAPVIWMLFGYVMTYSIVKWKAKLPIKAILPIIVFTMIVLIFAYLLFMGFSDPFSALVGVFSRAFTGSISPAYFHLEYFPEHKNYLLGTSLPNPGGILLFESFPYTVDLMNWVNPQLKEMGVIGSMPTVFWGEAYANFGPMGVPLVSLLMGFMFSWASYLITRLEFNPVTIGFTVWVILFLKSIAYSGFGGYLYNINIIFISFFLILALEKKGCIRLKVDS